MKHIINIDPLHSIEYDNSDILSRGNYANIYSAHLVERTTRKKKKRFFVCGIKDEEPSVLDDVIIKVPNLSSRGLNLSREQIENEIQLLLELEDEPNIVHIKKYLESNMYKHYEFIGLECCRGGDLFNYFTKRGALFSENEVKLISTQIISAINACHKHRIVHGDIKLENIGLVRPYDITDIKLLDFGGSYKIKKLDDEEKHSVSEFNISASPHYIPPEMASDAILIKERELIYTDFWELGVICFVLLTGHYPFGDDQSNLSDIKKSVLRGELKWPKKINISLEMKKYVSGFLKKNPRDRYGN